MISPKKRKRNWKDKYWLALFDDKTFEEKWRVRFTRINAFLLTLFILLFIVGLTTALISFTKLREFVPGYPDAYTRENIIKNVERLDSLEYELELRDRYFQTINAIVSGREPIERFPERDTTVDYSNITFNTSIEDSLLRAQIEQEDQYNLSLGMEPVAQFTGLSEIHFFPPVKGIVSSKFDPRTKHFGVDVVANRPEATVSATLDGVVIFTGWTMETGYVIHLQHANNLISVYKHNAALLKQTGEAVKGGDSISIIGDSGELYTSGPHLHFELWFNGEAINPQHYILF